jgi:hypothetical protein
LLVLQRELEQQITETTTDAAREQLQSRLEGVQRELKTLEREYLQTFKRLQDAGKIAVEIEFVSKVDASALPRPEIEADITPIIRDEPSLIDRLKNWLFGGGKEEVEVSSAPPTWRPSLVWSKVSRKMLRRRNTTSSL